MAFIREKQQKNRIREKNCPVKRGLVQQLAALDRCSAGATQRQVTHVVNPQRERRRNPMHEISAKILLAEYDRLNELEQFRLGNYERALQLYLTVITAAVGVLVLLLERQATSSSLPLNVGLLLALVLVMGEIAFLRLMRIYISLAEIAKGYLLIRDKFLRVDSELGDGFLKGLVQDSKRYRSWASVGGIITRALTVSQQKTTVVFLNCLVSASISVVVVWPQTIWIGLAVGILAAAVVGLLHVVYASWRYNKAAKLLSTGEIQFWI